MQSPRDNREWMKNVERKLKQNSQAARQLVEKSPGGTTENIDNIIEANKQITPAAPVELSVETAIYLSDEGRQEGTITMTFPPVTKAATGQDILIDRYELLGQDLAPHPLKNTALPYPDLTAPGLSYPGQPEPPEADAAPVWVLLGTSPEPDILAAGLAVRSHWNVKARAIGKYTVSPGLWSEEVDVTVITDGNAPSQPTKPIVKVKLGAMTISWDRMSVDGPMPSDFKTLLVAHGTAPSPETIIAELNNSMTMFGFADAKYYEPQFFRFRAVDLSGNLSPWSEQEVGVAVPLVDTSEMIEIIRQGNVELEQAKFELENDLVSAQAEMELKLGQSNDAVNVALQEVDAKAVAAEGKADDANTAAGDAQTAADAAKADALAAAGIANGKGKVLVQPTAPGADDRNANTLWIDTTGGLNTPKRWVSGTEWQAITDKVATDAAAAVIVAKSRADEAFNKAVDAATAAGNALTAANGKTRNWHQAAKPAGTGHNVNDTWFKSPENLIHRWNGSDWVSIQDTDIAGAKSAADAAAGAAAVADGKAVAAQNKANTAQAEVDAAEAKIATAEGQINTAKADIVKAKADIIAAASAASTADGKAVNAQNKADQAAADALAAQNAANAAATLASNVITTTTTVATGIPPAKNAMWVQTNAAGTLVIKTWTANAAGTAWVVSQLDDAVIGNLNAATINAGILNAARLNATDIRAKFLAAGKITAADIVTGTLTSASGVFGAVDANILTAGTINAARLDAGDIRAKFMSVGKITALELAVDSVTADQIKANAVTAVAILAKTITANEIKAGTITSASGVFGAVNANILTAGTVNAARLNAGDIRAKFLAAGKITAADMVTGTITATSGIIGSLDAAVIVTRTITGDKLAFNTISTQNLLVGDFTNLVPGGIGDLPPGLGWGKNLIKDTTDKPAGTVASYRSTPGSATIQGGYDYWNVEPGAEYVVEFWIKADKVGSRLYLELRNESNVNGAINVPISPEFSAGTYLLTNHLVPSAWTKYRAVSTVTADTNKLRVGGMYFNHTNGSERGATVWIAGVTMKRRNGGEVIIDGSLTASTLATNAVTSDKILANAITTAKINANAVTVNELAANSVNASKIVGLSITAAEIAANTITADKINVGSITAVILTADAITTSMLTADAITSKHTITGAKFQTTATANRGVQFDSAGLKAWSSTGVQTFSLSASTGDVSAHGTFLSGSSSLGVEVDGSVWSNLPGIRFINGVSTSLLPTIVSVGAASGNSYTAGAMLILGSEQTTNSTGRTELIIEPKGGGFKLGNIYGPAGNFSYKQEADGAHVMRGLRVNITGDTSMYLEGDTVDIRGKARGNQAANDYHVFGATPQTQNAAGTYTITYGAPVPSGNRSPLITADGASSTGAVTQNCTASGFNLAFWTTANSNLSFRYDAVWT